MTITFRYLSCQEFPSLPVGDAASTRVQTALPWGNESAETSFRYLGPAEDDRFEKYAVLHQVDSTVDIIADQQHYERVLDNRRFEAFFRRDAGYVLVQAGKSDAHSALKRMALAEPPILAEPVHVDLKAMTPLGAPTGAHFGKLRVADVTAVSVWGTVDIVDSQEWHYYNQLGELSAVNMQAALAGAADYRHIQLLRDRSVVIMKSISERYDLRFIADLQESIEQLVAGA